MDVIYGLIPFVLVFGFIAVVVFIWMAKKGQFDDLDRAANQIFLDDDDFEPGQGGRRDQQRIADDASDKGRDGHGMEEEKS
ncbi:cytochrome oxidase maturation protein, cbb3-type [Sulfurivirga caldicuralii]|uniref:Cytochrome oxidase maturation protein, cbb3-type n=1 Tax=Sulfurivirga caldicuralii TaxID=364032 RepID=A0A1N6DF40_9GAMM|nr:cbb3-type cytochrome oxidase assembly protein CcoS [Sulfurivirga caldicuralii]SIN69366.1 cytochrome oxidase maturation protein, cbb3-type [Sulfurivirga caldicuralii]